MPIKTKKISADEARAKRQDQLKDTSKGAAVLKAFRAPPSWDKDARTGRFVMTTQQVDRYGDIVVTAGGDTEEFERNPVALLFHQNRSWPIGRWDNLEKILKGRPPRLEGDCILLPEGGPVPEIDQAAWMIENGGIRACSIGFVPNWDDIEMILDEDGKWTGGLQFNIWELVECSVCPVPANPGALMKHANGNMKLAKDLIEHVLDTYAKTPAGLLMPRTEFEASYRTVVEEIKTPKTPPATDEEIEAADIASIEFEVAKLVPALAGATAAVDGEVKATLQAVDGKWRHVGECKEGDSANFVVVCSLKDGKRHYETDEPAACGTLPHAEFKNGRWVKIDRAKEPDKPVEPVRAVEPAPKTTSEIVVPIEIDTKELSSLFDGFTQKLSELFGRKKSPERVEPTLDVPSAPPSAEQIAAAKAASQATLTRLREAGRI